MKVAPSTCLRVDDRRGSKHLLNPISMYHIRTKLIRLKFGDVYFEGWLKRDVIRIGVELKRIDDLIGCVKSRRMVDRQLPGMSKRYQVRYLIIEGQIRADKFGRLEVFNYGRWIPRSVTYSQINRYLTTMENFGGVIVRKTLDERDTVAVIADLFHWWQKPWSKHKAHLGFFKVPLFDTNALEPSEIRRRLRRVAEELPHLGWVRGLDAARYFKSIEEMVNAPTTSWLRIPKFGKKMAVDIRAAIIARWD